ncbi:multicopper oxidase domain-containing protein [Nonomuraea sp. NPDC049709]|uniref:multicopper oxidase family protein n=1 Tax=Nonomuraea sp. NPDC049709 TaxID=3154736 RepID=UPI0034282A74
MTGIGVVTVAPIGGFAGWLWVDASRGNGGHLSFSAPLRIPPLLAPAPGSGRTTKQFRLNLQEGVSELIPGRRTPTWGANGSYLGPTIRVNRGDRVHMHVTNRLRQTTTLHWHGMHLPAQMDGGPHQLIAPGRTWSPQWTIEQPATTLWYHPHLHSLTAEHVYRGIAGLFLIDDGDTRLPHTYGVDDVPLIIQDKNFNDDGTLSTEGIKFGGINVTGLLGDRILINGTYDPFFRVTTTLARFRLLNGSNARVYDIGFADGRNFQLVGTDGGLLPAPLALKRLMLSPGERAEIVVAFKPGEKVVLRSFAPDLQSNFLFEQLAGGGDEMDLLRFVAAPQLRPSPPLPSALATVPPIRPAANAPVTRMVMGDFTFNDKTMDMKRVDHVATASSVGVWEVKNDQDIPHNFHMHGVTFQVLDLDRRTPPPHMRGNKDTVIVPPGSTVRLGVSYLRYSDPIRPYMFHCHILAHEDSGMMGQFLTVSPADRVRVPKSLPHNHG